MNVLIVAATSSEITSVKIEQERILISSMGMVNMAVKLTKELLENDYSLVLNMGIAGSFSEKLKHGDVVEVVEDNFSEIGFEDDSEFSRFRQFDLKTKYTVLPKTDLKRVRAITVNTVHGSANSISDVVKRENPDIESMEGASVFKVCEEFDVPCIQIRAISNKVEKRNKANWDINLAVKNLNIAVENILNNL